MNIDIQQYRSTIGVYYSVIINKTKISVNHSDKKQKSNIKIMLLCLALLFSKVDISNQTFTNLSYRNSLMKSETLIFKQGPLNEPAMHVWFGLNWSTGGLSITKLQHILNGKNLGI